MNTLTYRNMADHLGKKATRTLRGKVATYLYDNGSQQIGLVYHSTTVVLMDNCGRIVLNNGGYYTPTTKNRMNMVLNAYGWYLYQKNKEWYVEAPNGDTYDYVNGMHIDVMEGTVRYR